MAELTREQARRLTDVEVAMFLRRIWTKDQEHIGITVEDSLTLINIVAAHGDRMADSFAPHPYPAR